MLIKYKRIWLESNFVGKLDHFLVNYSTLISVVKAGFDKLSWPLPLFCSHDGLKLSGRQFSLGYEMSQADVLVQLGQAFGVVKEFMALLVLRACFDHHAASD